MSARTPDSRLAFGPFVLELATSRLTRGGKTVALGDRAFGVLVELATHPGDVLSKDTLIERVWPDVGVSDEALSQAIHELRRALGDNPRAPTYVQTVHGRGYRFIAPVHKAAATESTRTDGSPRARRVAAIAGLVLLLSAAVTWTVFRGRSHDAVSRRIEELIRLPGGAFKPAFSRDGRSVAVVSTDEGGTHSLFLVRLGVPRALQLTRSVDVRGPSPTFSADGNWVLFTSYRRYDAGTVVPDVWRVSVLGGPPELVEPSASAAHQDHSGRHLVFARLGAPGTSVVVRLGDGSERTVAEHGFWPRWSPDGEWIAYTTSDPEGGSGDLFVVRPDGSERRPLTRSSWQFYGLDWTVQPPGVVFSAAAADQPFQLWWVSRDGGAPIRLTVGAGEDTCPAVAPDGSWMLFVNGRMRGSVFLAEGLAGPFRQVVSGEPLLSVAFDGTGQRLALVRQRSGGEGTVHVVTADGSGDDLVSGVTAGRARWAARSGTMVAVGSVAGSSERCLLRIEWPSGLVSRLMPDCHCDWPDLHGDTLVFLRREEMRVALVLRELSSGQERVLVRRAEIAAPRLSPDGRLVAWSGFLRPTDEASTGIWVMPVDGSGAPRRLAPDGAWPVWDGRDAVLFVRGANGDSLWRATVASGSLAFVRAFGLGFPAVGFDATADQHLAVAVHLDTPAVFAFHGLPLPQ